MKIHLSNSIWIGNIDPFIRSIDIRDEKVLEITSHKKWVFVHPVVLCMLTGLGLFMQKNNSKINFEEMEASSKHYFERMGLFKLLNLKSEIKIKHHEPSGRFIPIKIITNSKDLSDFIKDIQPLLHLKPEQAEPIKYIISELVRNVFEHAGTNGAIVCAQYYKKSNTIRIGVVDIGVGIEKTFQRFYHPANDFEAINLALTPGITGTTKKIGGVSEMNAGAGLFFIKSLAKVSRDFFMIYSGNSMYKLLKTPKHKQVKLIANPLEDHFSSDEKLPYWRGTVVGIDLCLDDSIDFNKLLDSIRKVYKESKKKLFKQRYRKPKFI